MNRSQERYIRARQRVQQLESTLSRLVSAHADIHEGSAPRKEASITPGPDDNAAAGGSIASPVYSAASESAAGPQSQEYDGVLKRLSLQATGGYVDGSATASFGQLLQIVTAPHAAPGERPDACFMEQNLTPKSLDILGQAKDAGIIPLTGIPDAFADRMLERGYFGYIATLWPILQPSELQRMHRTRAQLEDAFESAILHLVYATAGRFLETTGETGSFRSEKHFQAAANLLPGVMALPSSLPTVQILLLLAIYSLRAPRGPGAWSYAGMAMRTCIELGLHRRRSRQPSHAADSDELQRRIFWSCYCLDRQVSIILGRPFAISDRDIDVELPTGTDDEYPSDAITCFVHICRLRKLESQIQQDTHRVDLQCLAPVDTYLQQLQQWRSEIPRHQQIANGRSTSHHDSYVSPMHSMRAMNYGADNGDSWCTITRLCALACILTSCCPEPKTSTCP